MANDRAVELSSEELQELITAVQNYADQLQTDFITPCVNSVRDCGLEGAHKARVEELAEEVKKNLESAIKQLAEETGKKTDGSILDALKALKERVDIRAAESDFAKVNDALESASAVRVETGRRTRRKS